LADQLRRVRFEQSWFVRGKTIVDPDLAVVVPPEMPERIRESRDARPRDWIAVRPRHQAADATNSLRLCAGSNRPCRGPGEKADKFAPPHSITSRRSSASFIVGGERGAPWRA
jgi:hypothetical protein